MNAAKRKKPLARVAESVAWSYRVDFEITAHLHPHSEGDGITEVVGKIVHEEGDEGGDVHETVAGDLHGYCVRSARIAEARRDLFDVCDEDSQQLCNVASLVWNSDEQGYNDELDLAMPIGDLIVPWTVALLPEHRGKGVGLLAIWRFLDFFGSGAAIAVLKPFPLNHQAYQCSDAESVRMQYDQFAKVSIKAGQAKLAAHWGKLGFKRIPKSDYFYLDMNCRRTSLEDLIKKDRG
jgi:GNAT superfamily N-acetyltransferase